MSLTRARRIIPLLKFHSGPSLHTSGKLSSYSVVLLDTYSSRYVYSSHVVTKVRCKLITRRESKQGMFKCSISIRLLTTLPTPIVDHRGQSTRFERQIAHVATIPK